MLRVTPLLPGAYLARESQGQRLVIVPAIPDGWAHRRELKAAHLWDFAEPLSPAMDRLLATSVGAVFALRRSSRDWAEESCTVS